MKKGICLCLSVLMIVCFCAGCSKEEQKETTLPTTESIGAEKEMVTVENVSPYGGRYLEYGDEEIVSGIYAMRFTNNSNQTISSAQFIFSDGTQELSFRLEMLPAGQSVIVAEQNQLPAFAKQLQAVDSTVTYLESGLENTGSVKTTANEDGTVRIENCTKEMLPLIRVFFRPTDENGNMIGGPCRSAMVDGIEGGAAVDIAAEGWDETCVVVTVLVVNE